MTLPVERTVAILNTKQFLYDLMDPARTPKVPYAIRRQARQLLKHFPGNYDLLQAATTLPEVFGTTEKLVRTSSTPILSAMTHKAKLKTKRRKK